MDGAPLDPHSEVWQHHTNTFEKDTVAAGIRKHYADPETLDIDDYLLYSALCQGLMYSHSLEAMRYQTHCHGSLFWMYNDCWGEVGWTIIDYYLRRKPAWYFVRRAYAPVRIILRADGEQIRGVIVNDTGETVSQKVEYGYISLDGVVTDLQQIQVEVPPLGRTEFAQFPRGDHDPTRGLWLARTPDTPEILPAIFRAADYRQLKTSDPGITACIISATDTACHLQASAQAYAHAVHFTLPVGAVPSDNYFDLPPGETRDIHIESSESFDPAQIDVVSVY
jgi:beta-mannosidase